eukprot:1596263-Prymnesium_polylepis.1
MEQGAEERHVLLGQLVAHRGARSHACLPITHQRLVRRSMRPVRREALADRDVAVRVALHLEIDVGGSTIRDHVRAERDAVEAQEEVLLRVDRLDLDAKSLIVQLADAIGLSTCSVRRVVQDLAVVDVQGGGDELAILDLLAVHARFLGAALEAAAVGRVCGVDLVDGAVPDGAGVGLTIERILTQPQDRHATLVILTKPNWRP